MTFSAPRKGEVLRQTKETDIEISLALDGQGQTQITTGVPFLDHMLTLFAVHGFFDLTIRASGDLEVDDHHTVEDVGICLGLAIKKALADFAGIRRYGQAAIPMDEALARVTIDLSNRPYLHYAVTLADQKIGRFDANLAKEFLRALCLHAGMTLHVEVPHGDNSHHIVEAIFKALGRAMDQAVALEPRSRGATLSSKGML